MDEKELLMSVRDTLLRSEFILGQLSRKPDMTYADAISLAEAYAYLALVKTESIHVAYQEPL
jgi:hypothetical protein